MDEIYEADQTNLLQIRHFLWVWYALLIYFSFTHWCRSAFTHPLYVLNSNHYHARTSVKHDKRDLGAVLLHHATRAHHKRTNVDLLLGQQIHHQVEVGRPNWDYELDSVMQEAISIGEIESNIFFCGPGVMGDAINESTKKINKKNPRFRMRFSKETFWEACWRGLFNKQRGTCLY